jgi:pyruvate formate lyase activating enzyme
VPFEAVADCLARNKGWVDGVVITGGEPTLHNGLRDLILALRPLVGAVKLDTNGSRPGVLDALLQEGLVDYVAMDVKAPLDERYARVAGVQVALDDIRDNIETLIGGDVDYEFRTTVCPAQLTHPDILDTARAIRGARRYYLQPFRPANCLDPAFNGLAACGRDALRDAARQCVRYVQRCAVRGDAASEFVQTVP